MVSIARISAERGSFHRIRQVAPYVLNQIYDLLDLYTILHPNGMSIGSAVFAGLTAVISKQTDRETERQTDTHTDRHTTNATYRHLYSPHLPLQWPLQ